MTHAKRSPSSAKRWMNCPGSIREIDKLPKEERERTSDYADEGSAAHALAEECLRGDAQPEHFEGWYLVADPIKDWRIAPAVEMERRTDKPRAFQIDKDMIEHVGTYVDFVRAEWARMGEGTDLLIEERVRPVPDLDEPWGTADVILYKPFSEIVVIDFKYGKGVVVEVDENEQAKCYALGALQRVGGALDVDSAKLVIVQPRAPHENGAIRTWPRTEEEQRQLPRELGEWTDTLRAAVKLTEDPNAPLHSGEWCRFCPALALCPEVRRRAREEATLQFADVPVPVTEATSLPVPTDPEQLAQALNVVELLDAWARACEGMAQRFLEAGREIPGYKLVRKRANRAWKDAEEIRAELERHEELGVIEREDYIEEKLRSPAQIEKLKVLGKNAKEREAWVAQFTFKPEGGLTIARTSDPRPAAPPPALAQFANVDPDATHPMLPESASAAPGDWFQ